MIDSSRLFLCAASLLIAVFFHKLFEGLSLGIRIAALPSSSYSDCTHEAAAVSHDPSHLDLHLHDAYIAPHAMNLSKFIAVLKPTLACLFAITTSAGIGLGMLVFKAGADIGKPTSPSTTHSHTHKLDSLYYASDTGPQVCYIRRHADLCCLCRAACC